MPDLECERMAQPQAEPQKTQTAAEAQSYLQSILDTGREPFLVLDALLHVITANRAFYQTFQVTAGQTLGRLIYDLGDGQWNIPALRRLLGEIVPQDAVVEGFEVTHDFPGLGARLMRLNGRKLYRPGNHTEMLLLAIEDVTAQRREEGARAEGEERLRLLVEGARDYAMILMDGDGCVTHWNAGAQRILGYAEAEVLGRPCDLIWTPEDRAACVPRQELETARAEGKALDLRWHLKKSGDRFWADGVMECLRDEDGGLRGFAKILRDATERKRNEEALQQVNAQTANILESITDAFFALDREWRFTYINDQSERVMSRTRADLLGRSFWDEFPATVGSTFEREYRRAVDGESVVTFEEFYPPLNVWVEVRAYPSPNGLSVYFRDISARKAAEAARESAEAALRVSEGRFRRMADAIPHIAWTTDAGGAIDYYNQRWYDYLGLDFERTRAWGWQDVVHPDDLAPAVAVWRAALEAGTVSEVEYRLRRADGSYRWHLGRSEPVRDEAGRIIQWVGTATDIEDRRQMEDQRERLLAEAEARAEREGVLNRIGAALRESTDPNAIQRLAAAALGTGLSADRCYFVAYDETGELGTVRQEWHREGLRPLAGSYPFSEYRPLLDALGSGGTLVVEDFLAEARFAAVLPALERLGLRAAIRVPLLDDGRLVGLVGVAMAGRPRAWTPAEVALVETVAAQTRTAVEAARLRLREHNIATQLQEALTPDLPGVVPGLALKKYHEAALEEAEVGGDFYDVFPLEKGCTALVVGDLSGKGLAAAVQVATVRNMLRATLYLGTSLTEAVTNLNSILAENDLLSGFTTLFVGVYDSGLGRLTYVNCGQEPGLVRRAGRGENDGGRVEELLPTGPVLGTFVGAVFGERSVSLAPGDALAFFTDGLTEAGPSHTDMLGIEGVTALLAAPHPYSRTVSADERAEDLLLRLIAGVDQYAQSGVRDDVCLLVAVVEG